MAEPDHIAGPFAPSTSPELARVRCAVMEVVLERGWDEAPIEEILTRAEVRGDFFFEEFDDIADCGTRIYLANVDNFDAFVFAAADPADPWRDRLRVTAYTAARYVQARPLETAFDMLQMARPGDSTAAHRDRYVRRIVDLIDEGRNELDDPDSVGRGVAEGVLGSIYETLTRRLADGRGTGTAEAYVPELMFIAVRPYLGHEIAKEELSIPPLPEPVDDG